jgi:DNA-binding NtrC family response regulator
MSKAGVLFVDDEPRVLDGIRRTMSARDEKWECLFANGAVQALDILATRPVRVVVTDIAMPGMNGKELITEMYEAYPDVVVLVLSGHWTPAVSRQQVGPAIRFLAKPISPERLMAAIAEALGEAVLTDLGTDRDKPTLTASAHRTGHDPSWVDTAEEE